MKFYISLLMLLIQSSSGITQIFATYMSFDNAKELITVNVASVVEK